MRNEQLLKRIDFVLNLGKVAIENKYSHYNGIRYTNLVPIGDFAGFKAAALSLIQSLYTSQHSYYLQFNKDIQEPKEDVAKGGISILQAIRHEVDAGWLSSIRQLLAAELFSDFLEMSEHLLEEGYKDPAAVMIGSVLEQHLRLLCDKYNIEVTVLRGIDVVPKKADVLNADLKKADVYGSIEQKQVIAWLGLRNSAAHGKYQEYTIEQVALMYQGVLNFISRFN